MQRASQESIPVWHEPFAPRIASKPPGDATVVVIGAGIAGITTAYLLQRDGVDVQVIDAHEVGAGETGRTTAHLSAVLDDRFSHLEKLFGRERTRLAVASHQDAIDRIETLVNEEAIACDFQRVDGYLMATSPAQRELLMQEHEAAFWAGFPEVTSLQGLRDELFAVDALGLRFPRQALFHAGAYLNGLAQAFLRRGGRIATRTRATRVRGGAEATVELEDGGKLRARHVVVATNSPFNDRVRMHTKLYAYRTYVVCFELPRQSRPGFLLWDLNDPYFYARPVRVGERNLLMVGGVDHKVGQEDDAAARYRTIENWSRTFFRDLGAVTHRWSGQIMEPLDGLAYIGRNPMDRDNVYIATGDSGHGMTHGTLAGMILSDLIQGRENRYAELYEPARKSLRAAATYIGENANVVGHLVRDWVKRGEVTDVAEIPRGEGAILRNGVSPMACYRDAEGELHQVSAVCTHLGCVVQWNGAEKSWDCPCHGSRFRVDGTILNGPAHTPLEKGDRSIFPERARGGGANVGKK